MLEAVNLAEKFALFTETWSPRIVGEIDNYHIRIVKLLGQLVWHHHEAEDELILVLKGNLLLKLRDGDVRVNAGEFVIIPRGVDHLPVADEEVQVLLFEAGSTVNTGNVYNERTVIDLKRV